MPRSALLLSPRPFHQGPPATNSFQPALLHNQLLPLRLFPLKIPFWHRLLGMTCLACPQVSFDHLFRSRGAARAIPGGCSSRQPIDSWPHPLSASQACEEWPSKTRKNRFFSSTGDHTLFAEPFCKKCVLSCLRTRTWHICTCFMHVYHGSGCASPQ